MATYAEMVAGRKKQTYAEMVESFRQEPLEEPGEYVPIQAPIEQVPDVADPSAPPEEGPRVITPGGPLQAPGLERQPDVADPTMPSGPGPTVTTPLDVFARGMGRAMVSEPGRGIIRGLGQTGAAVTATAAAGLRALEGESKLAEAEPGKPWKGPWEPRFSDKILSLANEMQEQAQKQAGAPKVPRITDIGSIGDFADWAANKIGEQLPNIALLVTGAGLGVKAAGAAGAVIGTIGTGMVLETGDIYTDIYRKTGKKEPGIAFAAGGIAGALEALPIMRVFKKLGIGKIAKADIITKLGRKGIVGAIGKEIGKQAATEAGTEALQTMVELAAVTYADHNIDLFTKENALDILEATSSGILLGGLMGGPVGVSIAQQSVREGLQQEAQQFREQLAAVGKTPEAALPVQEIAGEAAVPATEAVAEPEPTISPVTTVEEVATSIEELPLTTQETAGVTGVPADVEIARQQTEKEAFPGEVAPREVFDAEMAELSILTSARMVDMDRDAEFMGMDGLDSAEKFSQAQSLNEAQRQGIPDNALRLASANIDTYEPRGFTSVETAGLVVKAVELKNEHRRLQAELDSLTDEVDKNDKLSLMSQTQKEFDLIRVALRRSGTELGRNLAAHKLTLNQDYDLISVRNRAKTAKLGEDLSSKENTDLDTRVRELEQNDKRAAVAETKSKTRRARKAVFAKNDKLWDMSEQERDIELAELVAELNAGTSKNVAATIARAAMNIGSRQGVVTLEEVSRRLNEMAPIITREIIIDAVIEVGSKPRRILNAIQQQLKAIKEEVQADRKLRTLIGKLERHLYSATLPAKTVSNKQVSQVIRSLRAIRTEINKKLRQSVPAQAERLQRSIDEMTRRLQEGVELPITREPEIEQNKQLRKLQYDKHRLRLEIDRAIENLKPKGLWSGIAETWGLSKAIRTSFDVSAPLRQGAKIVFAHPVESARALKPMFQALGSKQKSFEINESILNRDTAPFQWKAGLYLAPSDATTTLLAREETIMSHWAEKVPGVAQSSRAYVTFLNVIRANSFDRMAAGLARNHNPTLSELKVIANFINIATGRGWGPDGVTAATILNTVFFAPKYVTSRFQFMFGAVFPGTVYGIKKVKAPARWYLRKQIAVEYARWLAGLSSYYALMTMLGGDIGDDPLSADFGKVRFGETRIDPVAGMSQGAVLLARMIAGKTKSSVTGEVRAIRGDEIPYGNEDAYDILTRFARSKLAPAPGTIINWIAGRDVIGRKFETKDIPRDLLAPMAMVDIYEAMIDLGVPQGAAIGILGLFGQGLQSYINMESGGGTLTGRGSGKRATYTGR